MDHAAIRTDVGFDRKRAEDDLHQVMASMRVGNYPVACDIEGIALYVCEEKADTAGIQRALEERGHIVLEVSECSWQVEDGRGGLYDEDMIVAVFDVPDLPDEWRQVSGAPGPSR